MPTDEAAADIDRVITNAVLASMYTILVYDASPDVLDRVAARLESQIATHLGLVRRVTLSGREDDETLFGSWAAREGDGELRLTWRSGLVEPSVADVIAVLHDISHADRNVQRALLLTTAGGPVYVERYGQQRFWNARIWWLAACPRARIGAVSPHLIDRFAIRVGVERSPEHDVVALRTFLAASTERSPLPTPLRLSSTAMPKVHGDAIDRALDMVRRAGSSGPELRRAVALMRLAIADARRLGVPSVTAQQVEQTVSALDVPIAATEAVLPAQRRMAQDESVAEAESMSTSHTGSSVDEQSSSPFTRSTTEPRSPPVEEVTLSGFVVMPLESRYLEDIAPILRDPETLRVSLGARISMRGGRGPIIGSEPADSLVDLALIDTILAAAWRRLHHPRTTSSQRLSPYDLRRYRRAPSPGNLLVIVLDHTALDGWRWGLALRPYLRDAYVRRSAVALVQVGTAPPETMSRDSIASEELRARRLHVRNIRARALYETMAAPRGRATPLAHGLELATQTIRAATTRGRGRSTKIQLVVVTDGRGNVPLSASHTGSITVPVRAEGVRDALEVAGQIRALRYVDAVVLHHRTDSHVDLPMRLAQALGGSALSLAMGSEGPL